MIKDKRSFFERLTGTVNIDDEDEENPRSIPVQTQREESRNEDAAEEGQLTVDMYQTDAEIVVLSMIAGVEPDALNIAITRDMVTIKGSRTVPQQVPEENYYYKELYWGPFSRTIVLPQEIEPEAAQAFEKNGLLTIKLPKIDKAKVQRIKVKSL